MLPRDLLYDRGCVRELIDVVEQVPFRAAARGLRRFDEETVAQLLLWAVLRWERTPVLQIVESLLDDPAAVVRSLDETLEAKCEQHGERRPAADEAAALRHDPALQAGVSGWIDAAAEEASSLGHRYVGVEHVLLAMVRSESSPPAASLASHGLTHARLRDALLAALAACEPVPTAPAGEAAAAIAVEGSAAAGGAIESLEPVDDKVPWGARWDSPAAGVPRRFGVAVLMLLVTMYAVLFSVMEVMGAHPAVFLGIGIFVTVVGLGQMLLFGGQFPRAASIWAGAVALPVEVAVAIVVNATVYRRLGSLPDFVALVFLAGVFCIPLGALAGYLSGGLTAGMFLIVNWYADRHKRAEAPRDEQITSQPGDA